MCSAREGAGLGGLVTSCSSEHASTTQFFCPVLNTALLCSVSQPSPAPQELSEQPASPTSPLGGLQGGRAQEAPTASQGLLKLFQRNTPMEDLGAKGVSADGEPHCCAGPGVAGVGWSAALRWPCAVPGDILPDGCRRLWASTRPRGPRDARAVPC